MIDLLGKLLKLEEHSSESAFDSGDSRLMDYVLHENAM